MRHGGVVTCQSSMCSGAFGVCSDGALQCLVRLVKNRRCFSLSLLTTLHPYNVWQKLRSVHAHTVCISPPFPCLTVVGRERGGGTSSTQITLVRPKGARFEMKSPA